MGEWKIFSRNLLNISSRIIFEDLDEYEEEFGEVARNHLFDIGESTSLDREVTPKEEYFSIIFNGFSEISDSYEILKDIPIYIRSFPYRNKRIEKPRFLRYQIENYFEEVYILKERLIAYLKHIKRCFRGDKRQRKIYEEIKPLFTLINKSLKGIIKVRGSHVHKKRFQDKDLSRLESLKLHTKFETFDNPEFLNNYYKHTYRQIRKKWKHKFYDYNETIEKILSAYGKVLHDILLNDEKDELVYPSKYAS